MSPLASKPPFPLANQQNDWVVPVMLAPSMLVMTSFALHLGTGITALSSPALLLFIGLLALAYCGRSIYRQGNQPRHRQICLFCGLIILIYLQLLLPRLWGWPGL